MGYREHVCTIERRGLCTLVRKGLTFVDHELGGVQVEHSFVELTPNKHRKQIIFVLNVYSNPSNRRQRFRALLQKALKTAGSQTLIAGGDFNAAEAAWGYGYSTAKGRNLAQGTPELDFALITDPAHPTRLGNSATRDTTPDLTFVRNAGTANVTWSKQHDETFTRSTTEAEEARAKALLNAHSNNVGTRFVDAAEYERGSRFAVTVVDSDGETKISASVTCERAEEAEEIAVALALTDPACKTVLCDSRQVIRNFAKERISLRAARIISQRQVHREPEPPTRLLWFPAHVGEVSEEHRNGNETAHARARELTNRTGDGHPWYSSKDRMTSYNEITKAFRLARRTLPPPSDKLDRAQAVALRQLQTRTYPNPAQYHRMFPEIYTTNTCKVCRKEVATLTHMLWDCTKDPHGANSGTLQPRLSAALCSPSLDDQLWAIQQACEAVKRQDFDAPRRAKRTSGNAPKRVT
ncbi:hypothetical protein HPB47_010199 [Ixodes persulcatus]|uniref:Uncharacterized protein n=1 Tax=Ixodes persulcatus TaxID=34615 RepID=A0AC60NZT2_IXOPE|nr:hypothetical protein HPB47_010199 [Ixodes persulcatus]